MALTATSRAQHGTYKLGSQWGRVEYGVDCVDRANEQLAALGIERPFLLSTRSVERCGLVDRVRTVLGVELVGESAGCRAHVPEDVASTISAEIRVADADGIAALGGSSVIDTAKAAALQIADGDGSSRSFAEIRASGPPTATPIPILALPTTLSGAEFTGVVATTDRGGVKHLMVESRLAPASILLDPKLTVATPERLWRSTGVKTLSDAIEQISFAANPAIDALCARSIEFFTEALSAAPVDLPGRLQCQLAAWLSLFGLHDGASSVGLGGALRHQVAVTFGAAHGEVTCVLLPSVVRFNAAAIPDRAELVAVPLGVELRRNGIETWDAVAGRLEDLIVELGLPRRLSEIAERGPDLGALAERVMDEPAARANPRPPSSAGEIVELLEEAW